MKKKRKIWLLVGAILMIAGGLLFTVTMCAAKWDFGRLNTVHYTPHTYEVTEDFENISVHGGSMLITFLPSQDGLCRVECPEQEGLTYSVSVENSVLHVSLEDTRNWYADIGISFDRPALFLFLPKTAYTSLTVETQSGDVDIAAGFAFERVSVSGSSSAVSCVAYVSEQLEVTTESGNITVWGSSGVVSPVASVLRTASGKVALRAVTAETVSVQTESGNVLLEDSTADTLNVKTASGNVHFENSRAFTSSVYTASGKVTERE